MLFDRKLLFLIILQNVTT